MRRITNLVLFILLFSSFIGCKKDDVIVQEFRILSERVFNGQKNITVAVEYEYPSALKFVDGYISESSDMDNQIIVNGEVYSRRNFAIIFNGLKGNTTYYYYYICSNGIDCLKKSEIKTITTNDCSLPTVTTNDVTNITYTSAVCGGEVTNDGAAVITAKGVCYGLSQNPTIGGNHTIDTSETSTFITMLDNLESNVRYYVRAYATNIKGTTYGEQKMFITQNGLPKVSTSTVMNITTNTASCGGNVIEDGGFDVISRGVCWSLTGLPTIENSHTEDGMGVGSFTSELTGLEENTRYNVRAYATNVNGTNYGIQRSFTTHY